MNNPSHEDQVVAVFARVLGIDAAQVTDELRYNTIPQWDSIAHMSVVAALEAWLVEDAGPEREAP